jgi:hypothetical protein
VNECVKNECINEMSWENFSRYANKRNE